MFMCKESGAKVKTDSTNVVLSCLRLVSVNQVRVVLETVSTVRLELMF